MPENNVQQQAARLSQLRSLDRDIAAKESELLKLKAARDAKQAEFDEAQKELAK